jgi:hypothetical protein
VRALVAIMARELRERWTLPLAVFCFGFVPLLLALRVGERPRAVSLVLAAPVGWTVALLLGGSVIARDLGDGRLAFFFARPVPWWAIAGGKLLAGLLLTLGTTVAAALPAMLAEGRWTDYAAVLRESASGGGPAVFLAVLVAVIAMGHAAAVVYRARSTWAALDVLLFAAAVLGAILLFRAFVRLGVVSSAQPPEAWRLVLQLLLFTCVPLAAAAAQTAFGRSDLRHGHRALSMTFWAGALACFAVVGSSLARERAATPAEFQKRHVAAAAGDGRFVALLAMDPPPQGRAASFLLDTTSGRSLRIPIQSPSALSPDGRYAVWAEEAPFWRPHDLDLQLARLDGPAPEVETVELDPPLPTASVEGFALAAGARQVAIVQQQALSVHDLPSGRSLSRTSGSDGDWVTAAFLPDGRVRALRRVRPVVGGPGRGVIPGFLELVELGGGVPSSRVSFEAVGHAMPASDITGDLVLLYEPLLPRIVSLHDARSGRRLRRFESDPATGWVVRDAALVAGGVVAVVESAGPQSRLRLAAEGAPDRLVELPRGHAALSAVLPGGRLALGLHAEPASAPHAGAPAAETVIVAGASGELVRREPGLLPVRLGGPAALFESSAGELVRLDVDTGQRHVVLAAKPSR